VIGETGILFPDTLPDNATLPLAAANIAPLVLAPPRVIHRDHLREFEEYLRAKGWPYVVVDEAKKVVFAASHIKSFHFLVYSAHGPNLLVVVAPRLGPAWRIVMAEWEKVFGKDFRACACWHDGGGWRVRYMDDTRAELEEVL
jgi:hypothetical protein